MEQTVGNELAEISCIVLKAECTSLTLGKLVE